ncbi:hypothetical protein MRB53_010071 [Persea americana]|uniref:Uncharacterized protein n=1 Tax=Persea americana TaxID=3435 RepID=A0ACC2LRX6_PERAE|nr:hypothetical protein MRB53_010071 [Persea americana]
MGCATCGIEGAVQQVGYCEVCGLQRDECSSEGKPECRETGGAVMVPSAGERVGCVYGEESGGCTVDLGSSGEWKKKKGKGGVVQRVQKSSAGTEAVNNREDSEEEEKELNKEKE